MKDKNSNKKTITSKGKFSYKVGSLAKGFPLKCSTIIGMAGLKADMAARKKLQIHVTTKPRGR